MMHTQNQANKLKQTIAEWMVGGHT